MMAIDGQSVSNICYWLCPCVMYTKMLEKLSSAKIKVIGNTVSFFKLQINTELFYINKIFTFVELYINPTSAHETLKLDTMFKITQSALSTNAKLALSIKRCIGQSI
jgi:hypothetical protein